MPRPRKDDGDWAKNFHCLDCGAPVGMPNSRCPECRTAYKRAWQRAYMTRYHDQTRPAPAPRPQRRGDLPPYGEMIYDDDGGRVQCHECGRFLGSLNTHIRTHGLTAETYKARYQLARNTSLLSPATAEKQRTAALARNQGDKGIPFDGSIIVPKGIGRRLQTRVSMSRERRQDRE